MKNLFTLIAFISFGTGLLAQNFGEIHGKIIDESETPLAYATIKVYSGGKLIGTHSDFDGKYVLKPLEAGSYNLEISYVGGKVQTIPGIKVTCDKITRLNDFTYGANELITFTFTEYQGFFDIDNPSAIKVTAIDLKKSAVLKNPVARIAAMSSDVQAGENGELHFRGGRDGSVSYIVDGVKQNSVPKIPGVSISSITLYTGGIPAKYGDLTSGAVVMQTKTYTELFNEWKATESFKN